MIHRHCDICVFELVGNVMLDPQKPKNVQERPNGTITGELSNGDKINVRPNSSDGRPTLRDVRNGHGRALSHLALA
jgi:hypothetical protein